MCLIALAWRAHADYPLVVAANRDEFHARPTGAARFWTDGRDILAGRDLEAMGTWLGVTRSGRFAAVTNYREPAQASGGTRSRGQLAEEFLRNGAAAAGYAADVHARGGDYRGFNLIAADRDELWWVSNRGAGPRRLSPGVYGLSNHLLDTPWPKVSRARGGLEKLLRTGPAIDVLLGLLDHVDVAPDSELPDTGVGLERERLLSPARIIAEPYGTRCSTVLLVSRAGRVEFAERSYDSQGAYGDTLRYEFLLDGAARQ